MALDPKLVAILACPECKAAVVEEEGKLRCLHCGRRYPVEDDIPVMLVEQAEAPPADWQPRDA